MVLNPNLFGALKLGDVEIDALTKVVRGQELFRHGTRGRSECSRLEAELGNWLGARNVCVVSSGTAGLRAALAAVGVGPGDVVLVSAFTFVATASAVASLGATPRAIDMTGDLAVDVADVRAKLEQAKAIVPVYVPGHTSNIDELVSLAAPFQIPVIEDACQAFGVRLGSRSAGTLGNAGVFSFQQGKQISAGEGGAIVSGHQDVLDACHRYVDHGAIRDVAGIPAWPDDSSTIGENLRMGELQAAVLRVQLTRLQDLLRSQRELRSEVASLFRHSELTIVDSCNPDGDSGSYLALLAPTPDAASRLVDGALQFDILLKPFWGRLFTDYPAFRSSDLGPSDVPLARKMTQRLLAMPIPPLDEDSARGLLSSTRDFIASHGRRL